MSQAQLPKALIDQCPEPGEPEGLFSDWDRVIWYGGKHVRAITVHEVSLRFGGSEVRLRVDPTVPGGHVIATKDASQGLPRDVRAKLQHDSERLSARQQIKSWRLWGANVTIDPPSTYEIVSSTPALYRNFWRAGLHLSAMVSCPDAGGNPMTFEQTVQGSLDAATGHRLVRKLHIWRLLRSVGSPEYRMAWFSGLTDAERRRLAYAVMERTVALVRRPGQWCEWSGSVQRARWYVARNSWTNRREPRPAMSFLDKNLRGSCLYTLASKWLHPRSPVAVVAGVTESGQQSLLAAGQL